MQFKTRMICKERPEVGNTRVLMNTDIESYTYERKLNVHEFKSCSLEHGLIVFTTTQNESYVLINMNKAVFL